MNHNSENAMLGFEPPGVRVGDKVHGAQPLDWGLACPAGVVWLWQPYNWYAATIGQLPTDSPQRNATI